MFVKLLGWAIGYRTLNAQLLKIWRAPGVFSMVDVGYDYFMIKFGCKEYVYRAEIDGPLIFFGHYLIV